MQVSNERTGDEGLWLGRGGAGVSQCQDFLVLYQEVQADVSQAEGKMWVQGAPRKDRHCE